MTKISKSVIRLMVAFIVLGGGIFLFQNCGKGFEVNSLSSEVSPNGVGMPTPTPPPGAPMPTPAPTSLRGVASLDFDACYGTGMATSATLATCLNSKATAADTFTAAQIDTCTTKTAARANKKLALAICLSRNAMLVFDHRPPTQFDIDSCVTKVGEANIAGCLAKNAISMGISQAVVDSCIAVVGASKLEHCLRIKGLVPRKGYLFNSDVELCDMVATTANVAYCLQNMDLAPATLDQFFVNNCLAATGDILTVGMCLRKNMFVSKVIMQAHIAACNTAVGQAKIATCLNKQGFFDGDATAIAALQTEIDGCVTNVTLASVAICLRNKGLILTKLLMQPHISSCEGAVTATNTYACLTKNFTPEQLPLTFTKTAFDSCASVGGGSLANASACLVSTGALPKEPTQGHITACARFANPSPDTSGNFPGKVGIVACLAKSGYVVAGLTQALVDTCLANGIAVDQLYVCLGKNGVTIVP